MNELIKAIDKKIDEVNGFPTSKTYSKKQVIEEILNPLSGELMNGTTGDIAMTDIFMAASFAIISTPGHTEEVPPSYTPPFWNKIDILAILVNIREFAKAADEDPLDEFIKMMDESRKD